METQEKFYWCSSKNVEADLSNMKWKNEQPKYVPGGCLSVHFPLIPRIIVRGNATATAAPTTAAATTTAAAPDTAAPTTTAEAPTTTAAVPVPGVIFNFVFFLIADLIFNLAAQLEAIFEIGLCGNFGDYVCSVRYKYFFS
jgi:hypothetical protein